MAPTVPSAGDLSQRPAGKSGSSRQGWGHSRGFRSSQHRAAPASFRDITSLLCCKCSSHLLHLIPFQLLSLALRASLPVPRAKHGVSLGWREGGGGQAVRGSAEISSPVVALGGAPTDRQQPRCHPRDRLGQGHQNCRGGMWWYQSRAPWAERAPAGLGAAPWAGRSCAPAGTGHALPRAPTAAPPAAGWDEGAAAWGPRGAAPSRSTPCHPPPSARVAGFVPGGETGTAAAF